MDQVKEAGRGLGKALAHAIDKRIITKIVEALNEAKKAFEAEIQIPPPSKQPPKK